MCQSKTQKVRVLSQSESENESDRELKGEVFSLSGKNTATLSLFLEGKQIPILIDSGASANVIDKGTFDQIKTSEHSLYKSNLKIYPYGSNKPLELASRTNIKINVGYSQHYVEFQVIKGKGKPLVGRKTATELGLLHVGMLNSLSQEQANENTESIIRTFEDRFQGNGKLKDFQMKLHIDETVTPVAQTSRQIPFKMRKQVEQKIDELEKCDFIEKVTGPSPWVSNLVPVPKKNNDIKLAVDMRQANKAILRERYPLSNIDDTLEQMNGACVFSRLDLNQAFHQIEILPESRYILTFVTPNKGMYRYKRLIYGVTSASEIFQRIMQQILQDIPGCRVIIDDIIIYADSQENHNKILKLVLTRLREKGLTLNKDKCEINKSELRYMGHTLSKHGLKIDDLKVKAVRNAKPPTNASEVKSLLLQIYPKKRDNS